MKHLAKESDGFSNQHVRSTIRYLDPERCQNAERPVLVPVIAFVAFWIIFLAAMYCLTVRVSNAGIFPVISCLKAIKVQDIDARYAVPL